MAEPDAAPVLQVELEQGVARLWLNRPARRNAFDAALVAGLTAVLAELGGSEASLAEGVHP